MDNQTFSLLLSKIITKFSPGGSSVRCKSINFGVRSGLKWSFAAYHQVACGHTVWLWVCFSVCKWGTTTQLTGSSIKRCSHSAPMTDTEPPFILLLGCPQEDGYSHSSLFVCIPASRREPGSPGKSPSLPTTSTSWKLHGFHFHPIG